MDSKLGTAYISIANRRCSVACGSVQRKNKGIVSISTNLNVVKLLFNELLRCLELLCETAILLYALQCNKISVSVLDYYTKE